MNQQTIDRIQPYIDEYILAKLKQQDAAIDYRNGVGSFKSFHQLLLQLQKQMESAEKSIMQIIFENESN